MSLSLDNPFFNALADEHRRWLGGFDPQYVTNWKKLLNANAEAAMCEAGVRRLLQEHRVDVVPNENLTGNQQRADFKCSSQEGNFFVEVACIPITKATRITGLDHSARMNVIGNPTPLNGAIHRKCKGKARQCGNHVAPVLLAVGTWHGEAAMLSIVPPYPSMLLTGITTMTVFLEKESRVATGEPRYESNLQTAAFIECSQGTEFAFARSSISGLLLCGLSFDPIVRVGLLHPNPARTFLPSTLPGVPFGEVEVNHHTCDLHVRWPEGIDR